MKIEIITNHDSTECDCCGSSWAQGGSVIVDGVEIISKPAEAACIGSISYTEGELLVMALKKMGHEVLVDDEPFHVTRHDEDYHGPLE